MLTPKKLDHCETCDIAQINPQTGLFNAGCIDCTTRHIAHLQVFFECQRAGKLTEPYMNNLKHFFGDDWKAAHEVVKGWAKRIKAIAPVKHAQTAIKNVADMGAA